MTDFAPIARFGLLLVRPGMLIMAAPVFGGTFAPTQVRLGLTVLLALTLAPVVPVPPVAMPLALGLVVVRELAIGLAMALGLRALVAGAEVAGHLSGNQLGLSYGSIVDPQSGVRNNMLAALYANLALVTFFLINGHHTLIRSLAGSYASMPIGPGKVDASIVRTVMQMLGLVFVLGVRLAAPLVLVLLVVELALGLIVRAAPAMNVMVVGTPLRLLVGLIVVAAVVPYIPQVITRFSTLAAELGLQAARAFR
ncbi:MAG: flagellar biosynthetic protein FliR [Vicinamibacterales bacterium]